MGKSIKLISLNVGLPNVIIYEGREVQSGIVKKAVTDLIYLSKVNFAGDKQADLVNHGGLDKAVCAYSYRRYPYWEKELKQELPVPSFGENLTIDGLTEDDIHVGDKFQLGEAILQVTQPRQPCYKLASKLNQPDMVLKVRNTKYSGYYFRVLQEGNVSVNDPLILLEEDPAKITISFINHILFHDKKNVEGVKQILQVDAIADRLRKQLDKRLKGII